MRTALAQDHGLEVIGEARNGEEGMVLSSSSGCPDVILLGIDIPDRNAMRFVQEFSQRCKSSRILLLATVVDPGYVVRAIEVGVNGYLLKDIEPSELAQAVRDVAEGGVALHPQVARILAEQLVRVSRYAPRGALRERGLTDREIDVLACLPLGLRDQEIASRLYMSRATVRTHIRALFRKLGVRTRVRAAAVAMDVRLHEPGPH